MSTTTTITTWPSHRTFGTSSSIHSDGQCHSYQPLNSISCLIIPILLVITIMYRTTLSQIFMPRNSALPPSGSPLTLCSFSCSTVGSYPQDSSAPTVGHLSMWLGRSSVSLNSFSWAIRDILGETWKGEVKQGPFCFAPRKLLQGNRSCYHLPVGPSHSVRPTARWQPLLLDHSLQLLMLLGQLQISSVMRVTSLSCNESVKEVRGHQRF